MMCDHRSCRQPATTKIINAGTRLVGMPMVFCREHADEFMREAMFPENYLLIKV